MALGLHDDDLLAAFAAAQATPDQRRATERLLAAFTAQKVNRLGVGRRRGGARGARTRRGLRLAARGHRRHRPLRAARADRRCRRPGARPQAREWRRPPRAPWPARPPRGAPGAQAQSVQADMLFATKGKPTLVKASAALINDLARSRVGEVLDAPPSRASSQRPASRFTFPAEPMVALRGGGRSLRHGNDGRGSADGKLTCRWPTHVVTEVAGVIAKDRFIASLGNGAIPAEALTLAREALLHDPYHDEWIAAALAPPGSGRTTLLNRLKAESVLRFGHDGTYDGTTRGLEPERRADAAGAPRAGRPADRAARRAPAADAGVRRAAQVLALPGRRPRPRRRDHLGAALGADVDRVGSAGRGPGPADAAGLDARRARPRHHEHHDRAAAPPRCAAARRSPPVRPPRCTTPSPTGWPRKTRSTRSNAGLVDEDTEDAYRTLDEAVRAPRRDDAPRSTACARSCSACRSATACAAPAARQRERTRAGGAAACGAGRLRDADACAPARRLRPHARRAAGRVTHADARLAADAARRAAAAPAAAAAVALAVPPRRRRARRWVREGTEARVDQVEPSLQVNPVAGFLMPDHLDESLEIFGIDGSADRRAAARSQSAAA